MWIQHVSKPLTAQGLRGSMGEASPGKEGGELYLPDGQVIPYQDQNSIAFGLAAVGEYEKDGLLDKQKNRELAGSLRDTRDREITAGENKGQKYGDPKEWVNISLAFSKEESAVSTPESLTAARDALIQAINEKAEKMGGKPTFFIDNWHTDRDHFHVQARINIYPVDLANNKIGQAIDLTTASQAAEFAASFKSILEEKTGLKEGELENIEFLSPSGNAITVATARAGQHMKEPEPGQEQPVKDVTTAIKVPVASFTPDVQRISSVEREASKTLTSIEAQIETLNREKDKAAQLLEDARHAKAALFQRDIADKERDEALTAKAEAEQKAAFFAEEKEAAELAAKVAEDEKAKFEARNNSLFVELDDAKVKITEIENEKNLLEIEKDAEIVTLKQDFQDVYTQLGEVNEEKAKIVTQVEFITALSTQLETDKSLLIEQETNLKNDLEKAALAKAEVEAKAKADLEKAALAKAEVEAKAKADLEKAALAKAEVEERAKADLEKAALAKAEIEARAKADLEQAARAKAEVEQKAKEALSDAEKLKAALAKADAEKAQMLAELAALRQEKALVEQKAAFIHDQVIDLKGRIDEVKADKEALRILNEDFRAQIAALAKAEVLQVKEEKTVEALTPEEEAEFLKSLDEPEENKQPKTPGKDKENDRD